MMRKVKRPVRELELSDEFAVAFLVGEQGEDGLLHAFDWPGMESAAYGPGVAPGSPERNELCYGDLDLFSGGAAEPT
jgi:hypothetical protein